MKKSSQKSLLPYWFCFRASIATNKCHAAMISKPCKSHWCCFWKIIINVAPGLSFQVSKLGEIQFLLHTVVTERVKYIPHTQETGVCVLFETYCLTLHVLFLYWDNVLFPLFQFSVAAWLHSGNNHTWLDFGNRNAWLGLGKNILCFVRFRVRVSHKAITLQKMWLGSCNDGPLATLWWLRNITNEAKSDSA